MGKRANSARNSAGTGNSWPGDRGFITPKKDDRAAARNMNAPVAPRASDLESLAEELLDALIGAVKASAGMVRILPANGQALQLISSIGLPAELPETGSAAGLDCVACGEAAIGHGICRIDISECNTRHDCRYANCQFQTIIVAPLESDSSPDNPAGIIALFFKNPPDLFDQVSKNSLTFARLLGALIEQGKSNREARRADLIAERQSIANEIHDSLAQTLVYARMCTSLLIESIRTGNELMAAKHAFEIDEALENGQKTVRELITDFRCEMDPSGLLHAIQTLTGQFRERNNIALEYTNRVADLDLPLEYEIQAYYIVREVLANIATHSGATQARLIIDAIGDKYVFTIEDNGRGGCTFTPVEGHYGMMIIRERAARINGEIRIESTEGLGTSVQLSFQNAAVREEMD